MKFGLVYNTGFAGTDPANLKAIARHADDLGFESFYVPEHIVLYPGARAGAVEFPPSLAVADPLDCLSFVAAATERILLMAEIIKERPTAEWLRRLDANDVPSAPVLD